MLAWEWQDPETFDLHFVTVSTWNLQHPAQFTDAAVMGLRRVYIDHLDHGRPVLDIRREVSSAANGSTRVLRPEGDRRPDLRRWDLTIADVYLPDQPQGAANRVRAWSVAVRRAL